MNVLEVTDVRKHLGKREIIKGISFNVNEGEIFGFLGPNGAGKTTTIRMLVGLITPNKGSIKIMGCDLHKDREKALSYLGAVVENPELYGYLSGRENLMQIARIIGVSKEEVDKIIKLIGLEDRINDKFKKYSLGMKQRLGLGAALLCNPKLLILDEPTNGLDPSGILDFREIVKTAAKERGMAVFVSSHILSEVQQLCDRVAFINQGKIQSIEDINETSSLNEKETLSLSTRNNELATSIIKDLDYVYDYKLEDGKLSVIIKAGFTPSLINILVKNDVDIEEIYKKHMELEQRYMELVEGGVR